MMLWRYKRQVIFDFNYFIGCFSIVLEAIPEPVATYITSKLDIPTIGKNMVNIGIGAGKGCSVKLAITFH